MRRCSNTSNFLLSATEHQSYKFDKIRFTRLLRPLNAASFFCSKHFMAQGHVHDLPRDDISQFSL